MTNTMNTGELPGNIGLSLPISRLTKLTERQKDKHLIYEVRFRLTEKPYIWDMADHSAECLNNDILKAAKPHPGEVYMICSGEYVGPNRSKYTLVSLAWAYDNNVGWAGNLEPQICQYHGWRGTTNEWAVYGHGVRQCIDVIVTGKRSKKLRIVFGPDLKSQEK